MKYSRQRDLIQHAVQCNAIHPTADMVYSLVREQQPNISLGTVYRNLNLLSEGGILRKISISGAPDRFDGRMDEHHHVICEQCGQIFDVELTRLSELDEQIRGIREFSVTGYQVLIHGICSNCANK